MIQLKIDPDLTRKDIESAIGKGTIQVFSSHPIENGAFVTPSRMEAESYAGIGKVYQKNVNISDVAWIDPTQGQYAPISEEKGEMQSDRTSYETTRETLQRLANEETVKGSKINTPLLREYAERIKQLDRKYERLEEAEHQYNVAMDQNDPKNAEIYSKRIHTLAGKLAA